MSKSSNAEVNRAGLAYVGSVARNKRTYGFDVIETAMVAHEWIGDRLREQNSNDYVYLTISDISNNYGSSALRSIAMQAGVIIEKCWNHQHIDDPNYFDGESWDWEFVPWICRNLEWDKIAKDNQYGNATWEPDIAVFMAKLEATKALGID